MTWLPLLALLITQTQARAAAPAPDGPLEPALEGPLEAIYVARAELVIVHSDEGRCFPAGADVCDARDPDLHVLRAIDLVTGEERWSNDHFPTLVGRLSEGGRVTAVLAVNLTVTSAAVLEAHTGKELAQCSVPGDPGRFGSAWPDGKGALIMTASNPGSGGAHMPDPPARQFKATLSSCGLTLMARDPELRWGPPAAARPQAGVKLKEGGDLTGGWVEVRVGSRERRVVTRKFRTGCPPGPSVPCPPRP